MTRLDARRATGPFDMATDGFVFNAPVQASSATSFTVRSSTGNIVTFTGRGFTYDGDRKPTGGIVSAITVDLGGDRDNDIAITGLTASLREIMRGEIFFHSLFGGNDIIYAPETQAARVSGDSFELGETLTGGRDAIVSGSLGGQTLIGDVDRVGEGAIFPTFKGDLTGGRDIIVASNTRGSMTIIGDAGEVGTASSLTGGADRLTGSNTRGDTIIGDAQSVGSSATGGADRINGRGGNDDLVGDVDFLTATGDINSAFGSAGGGADFIRGGAGNDRIVGDVRIADPAFHEVFGDPLTAAYGGNDRLLGDTGNDTIYGDTIQFTASWREFGNDRIFGNAGHDVLYGDSGTVESGGPTLGGADTLDGGTGNDRMYGGGGNDIMIGNIGNDTMTGGPGFDRFRFLAGSGADRVLDFEDDIDTLQISSAYGYADAAAVVATATVNGDDITLNLTATDTITFVDYSTDRNTLHNDIAII